MLIINIFIAQIPYEYDQMRITNLLILLQSPNFYVKKYVHCAKQPIKVTGISRIFL